MKSFIFYLVFVSLVTLSFCNGETAEKKSKESLAVLAVTPTLPSLTTTSAPAPTTTPAPAPASTTKPAPASTTTPAPAPAPTTTPAPARTSTPAPVPTTTTQTPSSTLPPTTPPVTPSVSTTVKPITSTSKPTAPPSTPTPPKPKNWDWDVQENGTVCILAKMNININLKRAEEHRDDVFNVPRNASATGSCNLKQQSLVLSWNTTASNSTNMLTFWFKKNNTNYYMDKVEVKLLNNNEVYAQTKVNLTMYETKENSSYSCSYSSPIEIKTANKTLTISLSDIHLEAYLNASATNVHFNNAFSCAPDSPDLVPILVGVALTLLIIIVLIAYLYSRKRNQANGYLSM